MGELKRRSGGVRTRSSVAGSDDLVSSLSALIREVEKFDSMLKAERERLEAKAPKTAKQARRSKHVSKAAAEIASRARDALGVLHRVSGAA